MIGLFVIDGLEYVVSGDSHLSLINKYCLHRRRPFMSNFRDFVAHADLPHWIASRQRYTTRSVCLMLRLTLRHGERFSWSPALA